MRREGERERGGRVQGRKKVQMLPAAEMRELKYNYYCVIPDSPVGTVVHACSARFLILIRGEDNLVRLREYYSKIVGQLRCVEGRVRKAPTHLEPGLNHKLFI